ncbi:MAG TPA: OmpH family outer membrane protein [Chthoniobacteraceae bacterium]|jgi:outer membrane protein|nr:OmpH family outer membrane protein [Chthoniobacteraceae bacterium]
MKKLLLCTLLCLSLVGLASTSHAQVKVGTVDMNKIFSAYYKTKDAEARINEARNEAKGELDERMDTYKKLLDDINKLNDDIRNPALSADAKATKSKDRDDKIQQAKDQEREINEFRQTREKQLQDQAVRMRNGIVDEITKLVLDKVKSENYDIVMDRSGLSLNGVPILIFAKEGLDFSDEIVTQLNKNKPKDDGTSAPASSPAASPAAGQ